MPPRRTTSSQNSQANDDVPPVEGLPHGQSSSSRGSSFDDFKKLGPPYFSGATDPTEAEAWILKMEKFFGRRKTLKFQDGLKPYLKNKISILKLGVYSEVVDRALIAEKDNEELHQHREQQRKRNRSDGAHGNQAQRRSTSGRNQNKGKAAQNLDGACPTCGKKHGGMPCYRETGSLLWLWEQGHLIRDCPENRKFIIGKPKEENKEDKQKP
ncbi:hypothetical protein CK203_047694 [Vitis vinifera]|uniref:Retrotransposon gag domain-containing protein n=1 Tax=Vitis vinifera TaxID=29760 RepID=A0A438H1K6_VITVI|nr:hypothetical protein CK203_047694 [Vitis vinifera]